MTKTGWQDYLRGKQAIWDDLVGLLRVLADSNCLEVLRLLSDGSQEVAMLGSNTYNGYLIFDHLSKLKKFRLVESVDLNTYKLTQKGEVFYQEMLQLIGVIEDWKDR